MVVVDVQILWLFISASLVVLMQAQAIRLAQTNRALAESELALRKRNDELNEVNARLSEVDAEKNHFIADLSEELRAPMTAILSAARIVQRQHDQNPELVWRVVGTIMSEGDNLLQTLDKMSDRDATEHRAMRCKASHVSARDVVHDAVASIDAVARGQHVTIEAEPGAASYWLWGDHDRLVNALLLLLENAVTYTPRGETVTLNVATQGPEIVFTVIQRAGPAVLAGRLAEPADTPEEPESGVDADERSNDGLGFALNLCKRIVEDCNGRIWIDSDPSAAAVLNIAFPSAAYEPRASTYVGNGSANGTAVTC
jgi:signal transduction histidine kinase